MCYSLSKKGGSYMTKEEIGKVLKNLRLSCGMTQKEVAEKLGRKQQIIGHWETGYSQPDANTLFILCNIYGSSVDEAFGFSKYTKSLTKNHYEILEKYENLDDFGKESVKIMLDRETERVKEIRRQKEYIEILKSEIFSESFPTRIWAYYGKIASAGTSVEFTDMVAGTKEYPVTEENENADYTIGVNDDSMEPLYSDGDVVFVERTTNLHIGDIGIFQKDNNIYIKQVGENCLVSLNFNYDTIKIGDGIRVWGKVLGKAEGPN